MFAQNVKTYMLRGFTLFLTTCVPPIISQGRVIMTQQHVKLSGGLVMPPTWNVDQYLS